MPNRSMNDDIKIVQSVSPDLYTTNNTTVKGATCDLQGYDSCTAFFSINDWGDTTTGGWEIGIQHSDDTVDGNFTAVAAADLTHTVAGGSSVTGALSTGNFANITLGAEDDAVYTTGYVGSKRYVRIYMTATGNQSTGSDLEAGFILGHPNLVPTGANAN